MEGLGLTFWKDRRVLVTGHTGFKGSWLTAWLKAKGAVVTGYALAPDAGSTLFGQARIADGIQSVEADIRDQARLASTFETSRPEVVLHLAAQSLVRDSYARPRETFEVNVIGTAAILDEVRNCSSVRSVVIVTTDKCYENREWVWGYREADRLGGHDPYSASKACAEVVASAYRSSFFPPDSRVGIATARAGNVIGGGDWARDRLVPDLVRAFANGEKPLIRNPHATRPWQFVLEPLRGYLILAEQLHEGRDVSEAWNFGPHDADVKPVGWIAESFARLWGTVPDVEIDRRAKPHEAYALKLDSSKARSRLGWETRLDVAAALEWTAEWYRESLQNGADCAQLMSRQIARYEDLFR